ncbi:MAG: hypothetical protein LUC50_01395 [Ruminococcus sp.]|nr:hypothetical protein [Ruminococcus sp.]
MHQPFFDGLCACTALRQYHTSRHEKPIPGRRIDSTGDGKTCVLLKMCHGVFGFLVKDTTYGDLRHALETRVYRQKQRLN